MNAPAGSAEHRIVVGVDGSVPSKAALAWAIGQAGLTGAMVEAVIAWEFPTMVGYPMLVSDVDWQDQAAHVLGDAVADVTGGGTEPVKIMNRVVQGNAAQVLLDESAGADLLIVGSRGHGGFVEALLGSTGQHCVQHATCPVVVIRDS
ncbi:MAG TPA: universal stress protein [Streptosporangiaceae bacterium]|nr:universal stress protein [Streptosporangiaceae bacterium]